MRRTVSLYVDGRKADLADDALILWTYTRELLGDPGAVKNSYTKQVTLPGTPANEAIFGHYAKMDRRTLGTGTGIYFNALKRTPFTIFDTKGRILESGYLKLDSVADAQGGLHSYTVTLYGGLGQFLYNLMYDDDEAEKRTLASLWYLSAPSGDPLDEPISVEVTAANVKASWDYLKTLELNGWKSDLTPEETLDDTGLHDDGTTTQGSGDVGYTVKEYTVKSGDVIFFYGYRDTTHAGVVAYDSQDNVVPGGALIPSGAAQTYAAERLVVPKNAVTLRIQGKASCSLRTSSITNMWDVVSFAPMYNGLPPKEFDAQRCVQHTGSAYGLPVPTGKHAPSGSYTLVSYNQKYTEWQMRDLRAYLQRPVVRLRAVVEGAAKPYNNGGWEVVLDPGFFNDDNLFWNSTWVTLPLLDINAIRGDAHRLADKDDLLASSLTPADILLSMAKTFGLVFVTDAAAKKVTIVDRATFYASGEGAVDLTDRIDTSAGIAVTPIPFRNRFLTFRAPQYGEFAAAYASRFGRTYGAMRVDTGYDFDAAETDVLKSALFHGAPEGREVSKYFCKVVAYGGTYSIPTPMVDGGKYKLADSQDKLEDFDIPVLDDATVNQYDNDYPLTDYLTKVQMHGAENAPESGEGVLVSYRGSFTVPTALWALTDDTAEMDSLNGGAPCWLSLPQLHSGGVGISLAEMPSFGRYCTILQNGVYTDSLDFGVPSRVMSGVAPAAGDGIYEKFWSKYIADRYDADARVMRCKVNWGGLDVTPELFARFYYYRGAVWSLNKISDHSLTTYDLTDCEFIRVRDVANYKTY